MTKNQLWWKMSTDYIWKSFGWFNHFCMSGCLSDLIFNKILRLIKSFTSLLLVLLLVSWTQDETPPPLYLRFLSPLTFYSQEFMLHTYTYRFAENINIFERISSLVLSSSGISLGRMTCGLIWSQKLFLGCPVCGFQLLQWPCSYHNFQISLDLTQTCKCLICIFCSLEYLGVTDRPTQWQR